MRKNHLHRPILTTLLVASGLITAGSAWGWFLENDHPNDLNPQIVVSLSSGNILLSSTRGEVQATDPNTLLIH